MKENDVTVPAIDMRSISQLADGEDLGDEFVAELIFVFLNDLGERVRAIGLRLTACDYAGIKGTAHAIKGSCSHFGAELLMKLSTEVEDRAKRKQTAALKSAVDSMLAEAERVRVALEAFWKKNAQC